MLVLTRKTDESITTKIPQVPAEFVDNLLAEFAAQHPGCQDLETFVAFARTYAEGLPVRVVRTVVTKIKGSGPGATAKIGTVADKDVRVVRTEIADQPQRAPQEEAAQ